MMPLFDADGRAHDQDVGTIAERFATFHACNPWVYDELVTRARVLVDRGYRQLGIGMLWEVVRWSRMLTDDPTSTFKLNNDYRSRYARLIMDTEPDLAEIFEVRHLRSA